MRKTSKITVKGRELDVSNVEKVFYPKTGFTKGEVINYYINIASWLLPHLKNRPLTMKRYPDGVEGKYFYEKQCPSHKPVWVKTIKVKKTEGSIDYCVINSLSALVWTSNLANLELHTFLHVAPAVEKPRAVAFDLDPGEPANILDCCVVALRLKALFDKLKRECFPKTSGSKGLQIYLPLNSPVSYTQTKEFARQVAQAMAERYPKSVVARMEKKLRAGKVFIDWSQNDAHKTTVNVYSLRAKEFPSVSTPLTWKEVTLATKSRNADSLFFGPDEVLQRVKKMGDLFERVLSMKQKLPKIQDLA
ncbi:MAG: non-homologous end-joining DNA ligase [Verrucomicrobiales bacterium]|nr:non-homologous end-joining DNA ligase [Verrucomicrobiales bacterium]